MANGPTVNRFEKRTNPVLTDFLKKQQEGFESANQAIIGIGKAIGTVKGRKSAAQQLVEDADFTEDTGSTSIFGADAEELRKNISGEGDNPYNFAKTSDQLRFAEDIKKFNEDISEAEGLYNTINERVELLDNSYQYNKSVGFDVKRAPTEKVAGMGEVYDARATPESYERATSDLRKLRNTKFRKTADGKYVSEEIDRFTMQPLYSFDSKEDYYKAMTESVSPQYEAVPVPTGMQVVTEQKFDSEYTEKEGAFSAMTTWVSNHQQDAARRFNQKNREENNTNREDVALDGAGRAALAIELGIPEESIPENFTLSQKEYLMEMTNDWMDRQQKKTPTKKPLTPEEKTAQLFDTTFEDSFTVTSAVDVSANFDNPGIAFGDIGNVKTPVSASYEVPLPTGQTAFNISTAGFSNEAPVDTNGKRVAALGLQGFKMVRGEGFVMLTTQGDIPIGPDQFDGPMLTSVKQQFDQRYGEGSFERMFDEISERAYDDSLIN
tara:strand:- start:24535 stop:26016 length:1482 start_codon:yes stop_codon:yes gene_type:complete